jgi:hypothetical protein
MNKVGFYAGPILSGLNPGNVHNIQQDFRIICISQLDEEIFHFLIFYGFTILSEQKFFVLEPAHCVRCRRLATIQHKIMLEANKNLLTE